MEVNVPVGPLGKTLYYSIPIIQEDFRLWTIS
jgi:hypothetical protein